MDTSKLVPVAEIAGEDEEEMRELRQLARCASDFLSAFKWCKAIRESYEGYGVAGIVGVYLFRIEPAHPGVDEWLWVVVGDLPSAYLVTDGAPTPAAALQIYVEEMSEWVAAVESGRTVEGLIPVKAPATVENAAMLKSRLTFLTQRVIPMVAADVG